MAISDSVQSQLISAAEQGQAWLVVAWEGKRPLQGRVLHKNIHIRLQGFLGTGLEAVHSSLSSATAIHVPPTCTKTLVRLASPSKSHPAVTSA